MIPWDTFKTPQDAYEHTQTLFREGLRRLPDWMLDDIINGPDAPWQLKHGCFITWWASDCEPGRAQEGVSLPVRR